MPLSRISLLGVPLDPVTSAQAVERLQAMLRENHQHHVMTPNAEMLVEATRNPAFRFVLQKSALNLPDSIGLLRMARWTGQHLPERVTGVDTVTRLLATLGPDDSVFLLGAAPGVAERAADVLRVHNPKLSIVGVASGSPREDEAFALIDRIQKAKPRLLLVAFGAPAQDLWIDRYLSRLPSVRIAMGVGGTFDFIAGIRSRAPRWMQSLGIEWLWRLIQEPTRLPRIVNAVVVFPWLVLRRGKTCPL